MEVVSELDFFKLWTGLFGGLALFLYGMDKMTEALKIVAGNRMRDILARLTKNRFVGAITGSLVTAIIQSSSVTTVIMVGFVSAGLVSMAQCISVIIGANIGTTITAQILAFKVTKAALIILAGGFLMYFTAKKEKIRQYGAMIMGLGLIFFGMNVMSDAMRPLRSYQPFLDIMVSMDNAFLAVFVGALFTALVQSSSATTGIVIVMASQGLVSLPAAIAIAFGANIGTCATAALSVIGKPREAVRIAVVHTLFNVAGVLIWIKFIPELIEVVKYISPSSGTGVGKAATEAPRQIANAHTVFNVVNALIFIWFTPQIARLVEWLVPDKPIDDEIKIKPSMLIDELLSTPSLAIARCRLEIGSVADKFDKMFRRSLSVVLKGDQEELQELADADEEIDILHRYIIEYLGKIGTQKLDDVQTEEVMTLMEVINLFENMGDIIEKRLVSTGQKMQEEGIVVSGVTQKLLEKYHSKVALAVSNTAMAVRERRSNWAHEVNNMKRGVAELTGRAARHQAERLVVDEPNRLVTYTREIEIIENFSQVFRLCRRVSKLMIRLDEKQEKIINKEEFEPSPQEELIVETDAKKQLAE